MRAPKAMTAYYHRRCVQGPRVELAAQLARANKYLPSANTSGTTIDAEGGIVSANPLTRVATPAETKKSKAEARKEAKKKDYRVHSGDSLLGIARDHSCDVTVLAKANKLKGPNYMIRPGQKLKLKGCED
jgi:membrane-bound lytic murein transglycosylase D